MDVRALANGYADVCERLAKIIPLRARFTGNRYTDLLNSRDIHILYDHNRDVLSALTPLFALNKSFQRLMGDALFSRNQLAGVLQGSDLLAYEETFVEMLRAVTPQLHTVRKLLARQNAHDPNQRSFLNALGRGMDSNVFNVCIGDWEDQIRKANGEMYERIRPDYGRATSLRRVVDSPYWDYVSTPAKYVGSTYHKSLWVIVQMVVLIHAYLLAVTQHAPA